ncbi:hypothetical protein M8J76_002418 [Diaphorina citri]|nr:hypothetical protein M8J75_004941 [Diaphorina citri]KAI5729423.1 hypothetical protein M8J76_002418 [Diaphorina citri]
MSVNTSKPNIKLSVADTVEEAIKNFAGSLELNAKVSIYARNSFKIGVSGGSLIKALAEDILPKVRTDFSKWRIFFCDERMVPYDHPESTFGVYKKLLLGKFPGLTEESFVPVNTSLPVEEAAKDYEQTIRSHFPYEFKDPLPPGQAHWPRFDSLLLGLGPDGHTCSLFPNHPLLKERSLWVAPIKDSPKPPPERRILVDCERLPGFYINATEPNCNVEWYLDAEAGKLIPRNEPILKEWGSEIEAFTSCTPLWNNDNERDIAY